jgi:nifR3 family TIM-barrel protein
MAGVSNLAFRRIAKRFGVGLLVMEMISDQGIHYRNEKTLRMLQIAENEHPISVQIFGGSSQTLVEAAQFVAKETTADIIDLNMGCPVNKVIKANAGAKWLLDSEKIYQAVKAVVAAVEVPVTVKMRIGWDDQHINALENALAAQSAGAKAIAMHGRTRNQLYHGRANWEVLQEVANQLTIPLIGNGDIKTPQDAKKMIEEVGATAVMIARAALGNPWLLQRTVRFLNEGVLLEEPSFIEKISLAQEHLAELVKLKGEKIGVCEFRQQAAYYLKGLPQATKIRVKLNELTKAQDVENLLSAYLEKIV